MRVLIFLSFFLITFTTFSKELKFNEIKINGLKTISQDFILKNINSDHKIKSKDLFYKLTELKLFDKIKIYSNKTTLNISVKERPYIKSIKFFAEDQNLVRRLLNEFKICNGNIYEYALLNLFRKRLKDVYISKGFYNTEIIIKTYLNKINNTIQININVIKNTHFKIEKLILTGNKKILKKKILSILTESDIKWMSLFSKSNIYIKSRLNLDLKRLKTFYLDKGFIDFQINYVKLLLNKKKNKVSIYINIFEGDEHIFGKIKVLNNENDIIKKEVENIISKNIKQNELFSYKKLIEIKRYINNYFSNKGFLNVIAEYHIANINTETIDIDFNYTFSRNISIKKIHFTGNVHTHDLVLRKFIKQMEESLLSIEKINAAKQEILNRGYAKRIDISFARHQKNVNEIDIIFKIKEHKLNKILAGCSYNSKDGITMNINSELINFIGSGNDIILSIIKNKNIADYNFTLLSPNFMNLNSEIQYNIYYRIASLNKKKLSDYSTNAFGFSLAYSFRIKKHMRFNFAFGGDRTYLKLSGLKSIPTLRRFISNYGVKYKEYFITIIHIYSSLNKSFHPTTGLLNKITFRITTPKSSLKYYIFSYDLAYYKDLSNDFIFNVILNLSYGNTYNKTQDYPFFRNFSLRGKHNVRGYAQKTFGPRIYNKRSNLGGNVLFNIKTSIYFPLPIIHEIKKIKTSLFFDIGQIYDTTTKFSNRPFNMPKILKYNSFLKYSCGMSFSWLTPINIPIELNIAYPLNLNSWDKKEFITFSIGLTKY